MSPGAAFFLWALASHPRLSILQLRRGTIFLSSLEVSSTTRLRPDYDRPSMARADRFESSWEGLLDRHSERFYRTWQYHPYQCAGSFRTRRNQL
ncbi:MAG: hypothetical protein BRD30_02100 [Bacteroidetes bacterium QH_2_63_10]|nr:MAG: hypothetical protein BRD30_02100 [Bacteroidetes bacterium QH_2_63_10]